VFIKKYRTTQGQPVWIGFGLDLGVPAGGVHSWNARWMWPHNPTHPTDLARRLPPGATQIPSVIDERVVVVGHICCGRRRQLLSSSLAFSWRYILCWRHEALLLVEC
jgi:hypothetical protein